MKALKVSVAMITYNGASFIENQLVSILKQTVKPDEVIISDDGSTDDTIEVINRIIDKYKNSGINICLLTDNPIHGIGSNFEWAYKHTIGDVIFSSGQDDVWAEDKIEKVLHVYKEHADAKVVISDAYLIDEQGNELPERFSPKFIDSLNARQHDAIKVERNKYIEYAESTTMVAGPVISFKSTFKELILPLPYYSAEDNWIEAIGVAENSLYFLMEKTTYYRIHNSTTKTQGASFWEKTKKNIRRSKMSYTIALAAYYYGKALLEYYDNHPDNFDGRDIAIETVNSIIYIGECVINYMRLGRLKGAIKLISMHDSNNRYKKSGKQAFILSLLYIFMYSKRKRNRDIDTEFAKFNSSLC